MPMVKGKKYPYTKEGRAAAAKAAKKKLKELCTSNGYCRSGCKGIATADSGTSV